MNIPDIAQFFPGLQERVMPHSMGQPVLSDWGDKPDDELIPGTNLPWSHFKNCGFLNRDEAGILYQCAHQVGGYWLDIGAHTGWTALHMCAEGECCVDAVEPMLTNAAFLERFEDNLRRSCLDDYIQPFPRLSSEFFKTTESTAWEYSGVMIDGEHSWEHPLRDAVQAFKRLTPTAVVLLHDFVGGPVREATKYLKAEGMKCRVYPSSSQWLAVCWRGDFAPPDYTPDPSIDWERMKFDMWAVKGRGDFYFEDCV